MADFSWWESIGPVELVVLRRRIIEHLAVEFGGTLKAELEDVVQHAFVVLLQRRERVNPDKDGLYRYLKTVSRNAAVDRIRAARRRREHIKKQDVDPSRDSAIFSSATDTSDDFRQQNDSIWEVFCALDDLDRLVIWLHVVDGKSIRAIARELDLNWHRVAGIVEGALYKVRSQLKSTRA